MKPTRTDLEVFARKMLAYAFDGTDAYGGDIQDEAEKLGLIKRVKYDSKKHGPSDVCEPGDDWYVLTF